MAMDGYWTGYVREARFESYSSGPNKGNIAARIIVWHTGVACKLRYDKPDQTKFITAEMITLR